uniref:Ribosomal protein L4A n=1 Tax=Lotharella vacuolata TaxID=74820 RepID=A0A0H5BK59_9EUKA|nr:ribosomal protein L4A [Lotharella vacuolata]
MMISNNKYFVVTSLEGKNLGSIKITNFEKLKINIELINKISTMSCYKRKKLQKRNIKAGTQTSSKSWGTGRALARLPRVKGEGSGRSGQASMVNMCRGGRIYIPLKQHRKWYKKVNRKAHFKALTSSFISSTYAPFVISKGHNISDITYFPLILENLIEYSWSSFEILNVLKNTGGLIDIIKSNKKHIRTSSMNSYKKGPLLIVNKKNELYFLLKNIYSLEIADTHCLSINQLAPNGRFGRLCFFTKSSFMSLIRIFEISKSVILVLKNPVLKKKKMTKFL